jgi:hypothetical protein
VIHSPASKMTSLLITRSSSSDAPDDSESSRPIVCRPQQVHRHQYLHDSDDGLGSLESQGSSEDSSRSQRQSNAQSECNTLLMPAETRRPLRNLWENPFMMSAFWNKRARINDNRDDRIIKKQCKRIPLTRRQIGVTMESSAYYECGI